MHFRRIAVILLAVFVGCTTMPPTAAVSPVNSTVKYYHTNRFRIDVPTLVAMLSYTAADLSSNPPATWKVCDERFDTYVARVRRQKKVHENYPIAATKYEIRAYYKFVNDWQYSCKTRRLSILVAPKDFASNVAALTYNLLEYSYDRDAR